MYNPVSSKPQAQKKVKDALDSIEMYTRAVIEFARFKDQHPDMPTFCAPYMPDEDREAAIRAVRKAKIICDLENVENELNYEIDLKNVIKTCAGICGLFTNVTLIICEIFKISKKQYILKKHLQDPWCFANREIPESRRPVVQREMEEDWDNENN
jgi:hypothetical protein